MLQRMDVKINSRIKHDLIGDYMTTIIKKTTSKKVVNLVIRDSTGKESPDWLGSGWYRVMGAAGTQLAYDHSVSLLKHQQVISCCKKQNSGIRLWGDLEKDPKGWVIRIFLQFLRRLAYLTRVN